MTSQDPSAARPRAIDRVADAAIPTLARLIFAGVLLVYYWNSGLTKLGDTEAGIVAAVLNPDFGAYAQIFPRMMEAASFDISQLPGYARWVVIAGMLAEFLLPVAIILGLLTRLSALGMIAFIVVQSWVDIAGHGAAPADIGAWFDGASGALIVDQRAFWILALVVLVLRGAGPLSLDRLLFGARHRAA